MPLDHLRLQPQIKTFAQQALVARARTAEKLEIALSMLQACAADENLAWRGAAADGSERCALPTHETLDQTYSVQPQLAEYTLLAADGSQIIPSSHDALPLALTNASLICQPPSHQAPSVSIRSLILQEDEDGVELEQFNADLVNLLRDVAELEILLEWQAPVEAVPAVVALRDGSLELFHEPHAAHKVSLERAFARYQQHLRAIHSRGFILAGYIDRSRATLLTRMLELHAARPNCLGGLRDLPIMQAILPAGHRSALFELHSSASERYQADLRVHFFYLNVGQPERPSIARVEVPAWVAQDATSLSLLHQALLEQCRLMRSRPYPYLLHRAHEEAVVHFDEKDQLLNALSLEMQRLGLNPGQPSNKLSAKQLPIRKRR